MSDTQKFNSYTFFTPTLNVTVNVWDVVVGNVSGSNSTLSWRILGDNFLYNHSAKNGIGQILRDIEGFLIYKIHC